MCIGNIFPVLEPELILWSTAVPFDVTGLTGKAGVSLLSKMSGIKIHNNTITTIASGHHKSISGTI